MNNILTYLSDSIVPLIFFVITGYALCKNVNIFDEFTAGAKDGFKVVLDIMPTLIGLMVAVGVLRSSGALDMLAEAISPLARVLSFPVELVPVVTAKLFSSSAATGLLLDIYKEYGPDSYLGFLASVLILWFGWHTENTVYRMGCARCNICRYSCKCINYFAGVLKTGVYQYFPVRLLY